MDLTGIQRIAMLIIVSISFIIWVGSSNLIPSIAMLCGQVMTLVSIHITYKICEGSDRRIAKHIELLQKEDEENDI